MVGTILLFLAGIFSFTEGEVKEEYDSLKGSKPNYEVYSQAVTGYYKIRKSFDLNDDKEYITIIDFNKPSTEKRLWIIDMENDTTIMHTYVSHGRNTGNKWAEKFSNIRNSNQSSLGFYITDNTYYGKNGFSLRLDGIEKGINDNARIRAVVMHGAAYAEKSFIEKYGRLGRSFGCPAVPATLHKSIINLVKDKTVIYIHHDSESYKIDSEFVMSNPTDLP